LHNDCTNYDDDNNDEADERQPRSDDIYFANGANAGSGTAVAATRIEGRGLRIEDSASPGLASPATSGG
jgi:hypothetical protein